MNIDRNSVRVIFDVAQRTLFDTNIGKVKLR